MGKEILFFDKTRLTKSYKGLIFISENAWTPCISILTFIAVRIWSVKILLLLQYFGSKENRITQYYIKSRSPGNLYRLYACYHGYINLVVSRYFTDIDIHLVPQTFFNPHSKTERAFRRPRHDSSSCSYNTALFKINHLLCGPTGRAGKNCAPTDCIHRAIIDIKHCMD